MIHDLNNRDIKKIIKAKLVEKIIGICTEKLGYFIKIVSIGELPNGYIMDTTGDIVFNIEYKVIVMRPFKGEICDGIVEKILSDVEGLIVRVGPMKVFISNDDIPSVFKKDIKNNNYQSENDSISVGDKVRFKIKETQYKHEFFEFAPTGTMNEKYLGHISE